MLTDPITPKFQFFRNHFCQLARNYTQAASNLHAHTKTLPVYGLMTYLEWEARERYKVSEMLAKCISDSGKIPILEAAVKPPVPIKTPVEMVKLLVGMEVAIINVIETAIAEAVAAKDFYAKEKLLELKYKCMAEYDEMINIHRKFVEAGADVVKLEKLDDYLNYKYSRMNNPKKKYF